ncbi:MAG: hypothetical protein K2X55_26960 [Burkholderiaceae bacterium]|nr:hypothetical protein [Burkholderiaceae bacterium]
MGDKEDKQRVALAQAVKAMTENWAATVEFHKTMARVARVKYLALVQEGFTEEQALLIVKW